MPVRTRAPPRAGDMKEPSGAWHSSSARTGSQIMHHRCTGHANQIAMARNHVEDNSRHAHTLAHASSAVSRSADFGAASPSLPLKGKAAGYWGAEDVQPRAAAEGGYRAPWVPSVQDADSAWFRTSPVATARSSVGSAIIRTAFESRSRNATPRGRVVTTRLQDNALDGCRTTHTRSRLTLITQLDIFAIEGGEESGTF